LAVSGTQGIMICGGDKNLSLCEAPQEILLFKCL